MSDKIAVIGGGSWGTALAVLLHDNGHDVCLRDISQEKVDEINQEHINSYLPDFKLPEGLTATTDLEEAVAGANVVLVVVPSHVVRTVAQELKGLLDEDTIIVSASKGIEEETHLRMSEVLMDELDSKLHDNIFVLSGPTHAEEVVLELPTTIVVAGKNRKLAERVQDLFMSDYFRVYTNPDLVGVELGAAVKNIIAIAAGISDGLGYGDNTLAALVTRGIAEIKRLGAELGADPITFSGLAGLGDLIVTCASQHSRNRRLGYKIGSGLTLEEALDEMQMVAEGVRTAKAVSAFAKELDLEMPITSEIYQILFEDKDPKQAVNDLMLRGAKHELEEIVENSCW
ncbi:NAD(P)H-dependent glycerol-3-phosphate dehydrogenase [Natroniella sulfidigena]|uniref:NAD(P)H-dependent glycerol-3-phosphate dehydrogenase n=1 Tax=Natroniella sulfidigena TaxID=723921 RepID=UPI00200A500C|nr:NAD(P)H-dependent glycerol-3-phosphate dehydrogenase [Natroniella sulfidigena]MCK8817747.1 NAD(P)H-dependent glycerol-3-phosphate dehydrogenase [Natroniella sulfidigena]